MHDLTPQSPHQDSAEHIPHGQPGPASPTEAPTDSRTPHSALLVENCIERPKDSENLQGRLEEVSTPTSNLDPTQRRTLVERIAAARGDHLVKYFDLPDGKECDALNKEIRRVEEMSLSQYALDTMKNSVHSGAWTYGMISGIQGTVLGTLLAGTGGLLYAGLFSQSGNYPSTAVGIAILGFGVLGAISGAGEFYNKMEESKANYVNALYQARFDLFNE